MDAKIYLKPHMLIQVVQTNINPICKLLGKVDMPLQEMVEMCVEKRNKASWCAFQEVYEARDERRHIFCGSADVLHVQ